MDMGVYSLYPALFYFGEPEVWHAEATMMERGADGLGSIQLRYADKVVNVRYSKISNGGAGSDIQSENAVIRIDNILELADVNFIDNQGKKTLLGGSVPRTQVMAAEAKDFYTFIMERSEQKEFYHECKNMTLMVCEYLEKCRDKIGLPF